MVWKWLCAWLWPWLTCLYYDWVFSPKVFIFFIFCCHLERNEMEWKISFDFQSIIQYVYQLCHVVSAKARETLQIASNFTSSLSSWAAWNGVKDLFRFWISIVCNSPFRFFSSFVIKRSKNLFFLSCLSCKTVNYIFDNEIK
mgnify:CR=1 FL=1